MFVLFMCVWIWISLTFSICSCCIELCSINQYNVCNIIVLFTKTWDLELALEDDMKCEGIDDNDEILGYQLPYWLFLVGFELRVEKCNLSPTRYTPSLCLFRSLSRTREGLTLYIRP